MRHFMKPIILSALFGLIISQAMLSQDLHAKQSAMTLKQTVQVEAVSSTKISPDGNHIAYTLSIPREVYKEENGSHYNELHVSDLDGQSRKFITGKVRVSSIQWSADSKHIYYLAKRNKDKFNSVYRIAIDGGESEKVASLKSNISSYSLNSGLDKLVYLAKPVQDDSIDKLKKKGFSAKVYEESAKKNQAFWVDLNDLKKKHQLIKNADNILSISFHPKKDQLLVRTAPTSLIDDNYTASQYRIISLKGKKLKAFKTEGKLGAARWSKDGSYVAMIAAEDKHDPASGRLYVANSKTEKVTDVLKGYQGHVKDIQWISDYQLTYLGHIGTKSEVSVINMDNQSVKQRIGATKQVIRSLATDASGKKLIAMASSSNHPREVFNISNNKLQRLTTHNPWLKDIKMPKQQTLTYKARDGVELQGILVYPTDHKKRKRYPLIMMVHGGPESHISDDWNDRYSYPIKHAAANGFAVFLPNYRGSTGRGVEFSKMGQADYAGAEFNDLVDAITHLSEMGLVDKKRVGITGGSYGGYASAWGATALSEHFAASVMFVGISNQLSKFGTTDIPKEMHNVHARNYPWDKWQWMLERSPIYHTDKAKTPILIMHGENDTRVHPSQSMELYRYIKTRTKTPARLVFYPGEGHGNRKAAAQLDYSMRLMRWMEFYLKGKNKATEIPPYELPHKDALNKDKED
jgi:dipeptidyl aminopeptidase/acylaminoacyl peptidase